MLLLLLPYVAVQCNGTALRPNVNTSHVEQIREIPLVNLHATGSTCRSCPSIHQPTMTFASQATDLLTSVGLLSSDGSLPPPALDLDTLLRATVFFVVACLLYSLPVFLHRIKLTVLGIAYLVFCNDKSWKKPQDPGAIFEPILTNPTEKAKVEKKTLIFVRQ